MENAKELWDTLEAKYLTEDATSKKFTVSHFIKYNMVDNNLLWINFMRYNIFLVNLRNKR